jgi:hypothetical protein
MSAEYAFAIDPPPKVESMTEGSPTDRGLSPDEAQPIGRALLAAGGENSNDFVKPWRVAGGLNFKRGRSCSTKILQAWEGVLVPVETLPKKERPPITPIGKFVRSDANTFDIVMRQIEWCKANVPAGELPWRFHDGWVYDCGMPFRLEGDAWFPAWDAICFSGIDPDARVTKWKTFHIEPTPGCETIASFFAGRRAVVRREWQQPDWTSGGHHQLPRL